MLLNLTWIESQNILNRFIHKVNALFNLFLHIPPQGGSKSVWAVQLIACRWQYNTVICLKQQFLLLLVCMC